ADMAVNDAVLSGQQTAVQFRTFRSYYSENIVNKVLKGGAFRASHDHKSDDKIIPLPATLLHDLSALLKDRDTSFSLYSKYPFPDRKDRRLDQFQEEAWNFLLAHP